MIISQIAFSQRGAKVIVLASLRQQVLRLSDKGNDVISSLNLSTRDKSIRD